MKQICRVCRVLFSCVDWRGQGSVRNQSTVTTTAVYRATEVSADVLDRIRAQGEPFVKIGRITPAKPEDSECRTQDTV